MWRKFSLQVTPCQPGQKTIDTKSILSLASKSADIRAKKDRTWDQIICEFNSASGRKTDVTNNQFQDLLRRIKDRTRETADKELATFKKSCAQTGGGKPDTEPENE